MSDQHTPGPWRFRVPSFGGADIMAGELMVGVVHTKGIRSGGPLDPETAANAHLMAAAPDMLKALRRAVLALAFAAETSPAMRDDYEAVSAAIAKATEVMPPCGGDGPT
jgi:hypothetical protein